MKTSENNARLASMASMAGRARWGNPIKRFHKNVNKLGPDECWNWLAFKDPHGYGYVYFQGASQPAPRVAFFLANGFLNPKLHVLHKCDNPSCCNPNHLFQGTQADNVKDMMDKKRNRFASKLNAVSVKEIRRLLDQESLSLSKIGKLYGVHFVTIFDIKHGKTWKHVL